MNKKVVLVLLLAALIAGGAFAQEKFLSAGGGLVLVPSFGEVKYEMSYFGMSFNETSKLSRFGIGVNAFFDVKYAELNIGLLFGRQKETSSGHTSEMDLSEITLGLIGKYPINITDRIVLFPFAGLDVNFNLEDKDVETGEDEDLGKDANGNNYTRADVYTSLSLLFGVGFDFGFTESVYLRTEVGYGIVFNSEYYNDAIKKMKDAGGKLTITQGKIPIKIAVGFRF